MNVRHFLCLLYTLLSRGTNNLGGAKQGKPSFTSKMPMSSKDRRFKGVCGYARCMCVLSMST